jgi:hypothetical protein
LGVDGEALVGIDGNTEEARIGVDELILVPYHRVPQDTGIIKVSQTSHVIRAIKLRRVNLTNLILLEDFDISRFQDFDRGLLTIHRLNQTLQVATSALLRDPAGLLRIIRLGLELDLKLV